MRTDKYLAELCKSFYDFKFQFFKIIDSLCKVEGITALQAMAIYLISTEDSVTVGDLSGYFNITHPNASTMCKKLEKDGFIMRTRSKTDERTVLLAVTEKGEQALSNMIERASGYTEDFEKIPEERRMMILETVREAAQILKNMNKH